MAARLKKNKNKKNKPRVNLEPRSAHGRAVKNSANLEQEKRKATKIVTYPLLWLASSYGHLACWQCGRLIWFVDSRHIVCCVHDFSVSNLVLYFLLITKPVRDQFLRPSKYRRTFAIFLKQGFIQNIATCYSGPPSYLRSQNQLLGHGVELCVQHLQLATVTTVSENNIIKTPLRKTECFFAYAISRNRSKL